MNKDLRKKRDALAQKASRRFLTQHLKASTNKLANMLNRTHQRMQILLTDELDVFDPETCTHAPSKEDVQLAEDVLALCELVAVQNAVVPMQYRAYGKK